MKKMIWVALILSAYVTSMNAQVMIGSQDDPHTGAILELKSDTKGLLLPRISLNDLNTFQLDLEEESVHTEINAEGIIIYNTNEAIGKGLYIWDSGKWRKIIDEENIKDNNENENGNGNTNSNSNLSNASSFSLSFPRKLVRIDFTGVNWGSLVTKEDEIECKMIYDDGEGSYFEKPVLLSYQGSSSMSYVKKNFAIDILNSDGSSCDIKIGDWALMDSYNLKANYIDFTQVRNVGMARLAYEAACTRPYGERFP